MPSSTGMWKAPDGVGGTLTPIGPTDTVRIVTNDFMYGGGDGYTALRPAAPTCCSPATTCSRSRSTTSTANSPVGPGRGGPHRRTVAAASPNRCRPGRASRPGPLARPGVRPSVSLAIGVVTPDASARDPGARRDPQEPARPARRLPDEGRARRRPLRRQGAEPAQPRPQLLAEAGAGAARSTGSGASSTGSPTSSTR